MLVGLLRQGLPELPPDTGGGRYILNSAVITSPGTYEYRLISMDEAREWYNGDIQPLCTIGYQETADALAAILGLPGLPVNRKQIRMASGDEALVFRLTIRLDDPNLKGRINDREFIIQNSEIGLLRKVS